MARHPAMDRIEREPIEMLKEAWAENTRLKAENLRLLERLDQITSAAAVIVTAGR